MQSRRLHLFWGVCVLTAALPIGCGPAGGKRPPLGKVHGTITYNGKPVPRGTVTFTPVAGAKGNPSGMPAIGQIQSDGSYELTTFDTGDGAVLGQHSVTITSQTEAPEPMKTMPPPDEAIKYVKANRLLPEKYSDPKETPLKYTVDAGENTIDIPLKD